MEVIRKYIENQLQIMMLPETFKNCRLEEAILPVDEEIKKKTKECDIGQAIQAIAKTVPYTELSLEELREERLNKYEYLKNIR